MIRFTGRARRGFTLIELIVVIGLLAALAGITMLIVPSAMDRDRAATAATELTGAMQISRARAARDGLPRGIRLLVGNPSNGPGQVTEFQYIESPPAYVPNPLGYAPFATIGTTPPPFLRLDYTTNNATGAITGRQCTILNLTADQIGQIQTCVGGTLYLPALGTWHQITNVAVLTASTVRLDLDQFPDGPMGGQTAWLTVNFGLYGPPRPVLGEPVYPLPQKTCVDLTLSLPSGGAIDYDVLFAPSGQLVNVLGAPTAGAGHVFLWVRDPFRPAPPNFAQAGEQIIVVVKARSGAIGTAPANQDPNPVNWYDFGRKAVSGQ